MIRFSYICIFFILLTLVSCKRFEEFNQNPNEPTQVSPDVLLPASIRTSVFNAVDASFLIGNNAAQLTAKTLRLEVDAYNWNAFPTVWENWYTSLTDVSSFEALAISSGNTNLEAVAIILRCWIFSSLTNAYGDIPYFEAIQGTSNNFTPAYTSQSVIYSDILSELERANTLFASGTGAIEGDILLNGDASKWRKFGNSLRLRLLMTASNQLPSTASQFAAIVNNEMIISSNADNVALTYTGSFPNEFPLVPLKAGDFDAVAISQTSLDVMTNYQDPRLMRYARPNNEDFTNNPEFLGAINGQGASCTKDGASRLGVQYYDYPDLTKSETLGLSKAEGIIMTYAEVSFLLAEAAAKGWISADVETHYRNGIEASMDYYSVDYAPFGWTDFSDFYTNSGVAYSQTTDIWEQKWLALFFHGLEPYFELRRWYFEGGMSFDGLPFIGASCENLNNNQLPLKFLYPGEEQSLNSENYQNAINSMGGSNSQNATMWLMQ